jgi:hypothetical protein
LWCAWRMQPYGCCCCWSGFLEWGWF